MAVITEQVLTPLVSLDREVLFTNRYDVMKFAVLRFQISSTEKLFS